jgi:hypothetical protein
MPFTNTIETAMVNAYSDSIYMRVAKMGNRLRSYVTEVPASSAHEIMYFERLGSTELTPQTGRHGDTPINSIEYDRRAVIPYPWENGLMVDDADKARIAIQPEGALAQRMAEAIARRIDLTIIAAATGPALTGKAAQTPVSMPGSQILRANATDISDGNNDTGTNLTLAKLRRARDKFWANDAIGTDEKVHIAVTGRQLQHLLRSGKVPNTDWSVRKALVDGEINEYMGFVFHRTELLPFVAGTTRRCFAWTNDAIYLDMLRAPTTRVSEWQTKRYSWHIYSNLDLGAVRMEEEKVVLIDCDESDATAPE